MALHTAGGRISALLPPDHISCGATSTDEGTPLSINVEMIGKTLMIRHYVAEVATASLCRMASVSDAFTSNGHTRLQVIWILSVKQIDERTCEYTNSVVAHPTAEFMEFIATHNIAFEDAAARQHYGGNHNRRETPLFAASLGVRRSPLHKIIPVNTPPEGGGAGLRSV
jgi:hypothetical protein